MKSAPWYILAVFVTLWVMTGTAASPYTRNWYKPHRWLSDELEKPEQLAEYRRCMRMANTPERQKFCHDPRTDGFIRVHLPNGEVVDMDMCLAHGELRRKKQ